MNKLLQLRKNLGYSQEKMAKELGWDLATYKMIETAAVLYKQHIIYISSHLGVTQDQVALSY